MDIPAKQGSLHETQALYEKLGFSIAFYAEEHPDYRFGRVGKAEMDFDNIGESLSEADKR